MRFKRPNGVGALVIDGRPITVDRDGCFRAPEHHAGELAAHGVRPVAEPEPSRPALDDRRPAPDHRRSVPGWNERR